MKKNLLVLLGLLSSFTFGQIQYLDPNHPYDDSITTPADFFGFEVGEWHLSHDQISSYVQQLARESDRIQIQKRGKTYEGRSLWLLIYSSPDNISQLEELRQKHLSLSQNSVLVEPSDQPLVVYQGFSIHGNEASGANAGVLWAYHLAASLDAQTLEQLEQTIILLDPSFNPDGLQRFSTWVNSNRNAHLSSDNNDREYNEPWPRGRTNHYWFDLNRDWLPAQLPESQVRIQTYKEWLPNVLTDHHEMGTDATFFFQPGIPSRVNPLTPSKNQELTEKMGQFHASALNQIGSLYYTQENYDDFYYGKGSTYPDVNGGVGILFEQASSRGHLQKSENGELSFPFTIRNQLTAAFSTLKGAHELREELIQYFQDFYAANRKLGLKLKDDAYVFGDAQDPVRSQALAQILHRHGISVYRPKENWESKVSGLNAQNSYVVPMNQTKIKLIQAMFNRQTEFKDSLFYDISAWSFPLAFNLRLQKASAKNTLGDQVNPEAEKIKGSVSEQSSYGYLIQNQRYLLPKAWGELQQKKIRTKISLKPFIHEGQTYDYGTTFIPVQNQNLSGDELYSYLKELAQSNALEIYGVRGGLTQGIDLGSRNIKTLPEVRVALLVGSGVSSYDAGEIWHLWDQRWSNPPTKIDVSQANRVDLNRYTHLIMPSYSGKLISSEKIKSFVRSGGTLIAYKNSISWLDKNELIKLSFVKAAERNSPASFEDRQNYYGAQRIGGAIFEAHLDRSHPITFGISTEKIPLFRNTSLFLEAAKDRYNNPIQYTKDPLLSGYISKENLSLIPETVPFKVERLGQGKILLFTDNTQFRAFWYGTNRLLANAVFLSSFM